MSFRKVLCIILGFLTIFFGVLNTIIFICTIVFSLSTIQYLRGRQRNTQTNSRLAERPQPTFFPTTLLRPSVTVSFDWEQDAYVGQAYSFRITADGNCFRKNVRLTEDLANSLNLRISREEQHVAFTKHFEEHELIVTFIVHKSGQYTFDITGPIAISRHFTYVFLPGKLDASHVQVVSVLPLSHVTPNAELAINLQTQDEFGNDTCPEDLFVFSCTATNIESGMQTDHMSVTTRWLETYRRVRLGLRFSQPSVYRVSIKYCDNSVTDNLIVCVIPNPVLQKLKDKFSEKSSQYYEGRYSTGSSTKHVYCYINLHRITLRTYFMKFLWPKIVWGTRYSKSLKVLVSKSVHRWNIEFQRPGLHPAVFICSNGANMLAALSVALHHRQGLSVSHETRKVNLNNAISNEFSAGFRIRLPMNIDRGNLLESSFRATSGFKSSDWGKQFYITFGQEIGMDYGGPYREWFSLLCLEIFDPTKSGLFRKLSDRGVLHPSRGAQNTQYYTLAGKLVARAIIRQVIDRSHPALGVHFSRSFLAQVLGVSVTYEFFEADDPEFYRNKVKYVLENDPSDLELTFTEDVHDANGRYLETIELVRGGADLLVTCENRLRYLQLVTDHRLSARDQVEHFRRGFFSVLEESLFDDWDESDLELLVCGFSKVSVADLKAHAEIRGYGRQRVVEWFWAVLSEMTEEQLAQFMQFVTGSSLLPSGGVAALEPAFNIQHMPGEDRLPCAHTCFNRIDLFDYSDMSSLHRCLLTAITEGGVGFELT